MIIKKPGLLLGAALLFNVHILAQTLPTTVVNPALPGFDAAYDSFFTNQYGSPPMSGTLNQLLLNLQFNLGQILPVLGGFNDRYDFIITNGVFVLNPGASTQPVAPSLPTASAGGGLSLGNAATGTASGGGGPAIVVPGSTVLGARGGTALNPSPNDTNVVSTPVTGQAFTSTRDLLRALLILQDDVERMLPLVNALNGGSPTNVIPFLTNSVVTVTNPTVTVTNR